MTDLPKGVEKWPTGVRRHGKTLRINFMYQGMRCQESLRNVSKVNKAAVTYAQTKRTTILTEIRENRFDYATHFPESPNAKKFSGVGGADTKRTVWQGAERWLKVKKATVAATTYKSYFHKAKHFAGYFDEKENKFVSGYFDKGRRLDSISPSDLKLFRSYLLESPEEGGAGLAPKTANDVFTVVRGIFNDLCDDGGIRVDPTLKITNFTLPPMSETADPFERDELARIATAEKVPVQLQNLVMFNCWCGLSVSEVMGLSWEDIDLEKGIARIKRARVNEEYRVPKEIYREREVELIGPAKEWLKKQKAHTFMLAPSELHVKQRDNKRTIIEFVRPVFFNESTNEPWTQASIGRWFHRLLRKVGLRVRGPNQCRHTFASQCLSNYIDERWLSRQLGHSDTKMLKKHYARWIQKDVKRMADEVTAKLGFEGDNEGQKSAENVPKLFQTGISND